MIQVNAAARLTAAAKDKVPSKKAVQNWLIKNYGFQPGYTPGSNPYSDRASDFGAIKDKSKMTALMKALEAAGFKKEDVTNNPGSFWYSDDQVRFTINTAKGLVWITTPKKAKQSMRFSPYD